MPSKDLLMRTQLIMLLYLVKKLSYEKISFIEFGEKGNGLLYLEKLSERIEKELNIKIEIFGFDKTGEGLINPKDRDLPYFFQGGMYKMDTELLKKLKRSKLIVGDVKNTICRFF